MGELKKIAFEEQPEEVKDRVKGYWSKRADSFAKLRKHEMKSNKADRWLTEILTKITDAAMEDADEMAEAEAVADKDTSLIKVLDVGCGSGFFEVLLGQQGFEVAGIDLTEEMVAKANGMIAEYGLDAKRVKALTMDAENPDFATESFDVIITRNLTWTLPHPIEAYGKWYALLKKGGILLNYDAEYAKGAHNLSLPENKAHNMMSDLLKEECHDIYHMLSISALPRPSWDEEVLRKIGFSYVSIDQTVGKRIYAEMDEFHIPDAMFGIVARK